MPSRVDCDFIPSDLSLIFIFDFCVCSVAYFLHNVNMKTPAHIHFFYYNSNSTVKRNVKNLKASAGETKKEKKTNPISKLLAIYEPYPK